MEKPIFLLSPFPRPRPAGGLLFDYPSMRARLLAERTRACVSACERVYGNYVRLITRSTARVLYTTRRKRYVTVQIVSATNDVIALIIEPSGARIGTILR